MPQIVRREHTSLVLKRSFPGNYTVDTENDMRLNKGPRSRTQATTRGIALGVIIISIPVSKMSVRVSVEGAATFILAELQYLIVNLGEQISEHRLHVLCLLFSFSSRKRDLCS